MAGKMVVRNKKSGEVKVVPYPSEAAMERWSSACVCPAIDGCKVEPDGVCEHGWPSKLIAAGVI